MAHSHSDVVFIAFSDTHGNRKNLSSLYTLIKETIERDKAVNPKVKHVLLMPGDVFSVNAACSVVSNGNFDIDTITAIAELFPEDARFFTPGNHDYFYEESQLIALVKKAQLKVVISNTQFTAASQLPFEKTASIDNFSIAGLMTPETYNSISARKVVTDAKSFLTDNQALKKISANIIMSHLGSASDLALPYENAVIVGGHSHDKQITPLNNKLVVNTGAGECMVVIRGKNAEIKEVCHSKPSEVIEAIVNRYAREYKINFAEKVFSVDAKSIKPAGLELSANEVKAATAHLRTTDTMVTRLTADSIAAQLKKLDSKVDFVLYPAAAIRSNFESGQEVTEEELLETYYYTNKLVEMTLTGAQLVELLAHGVMSGYKCYINRGQLLIPSQGLSYEYDIHQMNPGDTIRSVKVNGKYINLQEKFVIATTDWVAGDIKKRFPSTLQKTYDDLKIFKLVRDQLKGTIQTEKFSERVISTQSFQEQHQMTSIEGNRRADPVLFDKFKVPINLGYHQANYFKENTAILSSPRNPLLKSFPPTHPESQPFAFSK